MLAPHVEEAIFEAADAAANPNGYANDAAEADRRATLRDSYVEKFRAIVLSK